MYKAFRILKDVYFDSVILMGTAARFKSQDAVFEAAFFMGTPTNKNLLAAVGFFATAISDAGPGDTILGIEADDEAAAEEAISSAVSSLMGKKSATVASNGLEARPRSLSGALRKAEQEEGANLACISLPGRYVESEAMRALKRNLHVFIFSDNVPLEAEVRLKIEAESRGLLCMGPDCGTAWIAGVGIGFTNEVPRGRIGIISASGTGLQSVACLLAAGGEGLSHGIGVGGRDLSNDVQGRMTLLALEKLQQDPATEAIIIISKPPAPEALIRLEAALQRVSKHVVVACLGAPERATSGTIWVSSLADAVEAMLSHLQNRPRSHATFSDPNLLQNTLLHKGSAPVGKALLGLYTGGTLAHEAEILMQPLLGKVAYGDETAIDRHEHCILDLGDDQYTQGRPHPMIDPFPRAELLFKHGGEAGVVLFDLVLGRCSHDDPAEPLSNAMRALRQKLGASAPLFVGSIVGTPGDSQNLARQESLLRAAGAQLLPDNAQAARYAALLLAPDCASTFLTSCDKAGPGNALLGAII